METKGEQIQLHNHFTILIYPFLHQLTPKERKKRLPQLSQCWKPWWLRLKDNEIADALDDTYFFLPYIRETLFPETTQLKNISPGNKYEKHIQKIRQNANNLRAFYQDKDFPSEAVWRFTYAPEYLEKIANFRVVEDDEELSACFEWIDAMLFASGVGFLIFKVKLRQDEPSLSKLSDLNYYLRTVHPPTIEWNLPKLYFEKYGKGILVRDLIDFLTQGMISDELIDLNKYRRFYSFSKPKIVNDLKKFMENLKRDDQRHYSDTEFGQIYGEYCQVFSYACIHVTDEHREVLLRGKFSCAEDRLLFEFANSFQLAIGDAVQNRMWIPAEEEIARLNQENRMGIWNSWRGLALRETAVFLATENIHFNKESLPNNIENDYLPLYLYTLFQKFQLFVFSNELMGKGAYLKQNLRQIRDLMNRFIHFRNQYWFNEVTRKPLGGQLYRKFQEGLGVPLLYELVADEVKEIQEHYERQSNRRLNDILSFLTFIFLPLSTLAAIFGVEFIKNSWLIQWLGLWQSFAIAWMIAVILPWLWLQQRK